MKKRLDDFSGRIRTIGIILFLAAGILLCRLFYLQVVSADYYRNLADSQYQNSQKKSPIANRGVIYFREKDDQLISAAEIKDGFMLIINPATLNNPEEAYNKISSIITIEKEDFLKRAKKENDIYEEIAHYLDPDKADEIEKLAIKGLFVVPEEWRFYPAGKLASQVLGFVGYNGNDRVGQYGIEKSYDDFLRGSNGDVATNSFAESFFGLSDFFQNFLEGKNDVIMTIEPSVQGFLEGALEKAIQQYSAEEAGGIIMDPKTGKILAMAAKPDFDPNFYNKIKNPSVFLNPLVSSVFEVGSVMKPITLSSAIDKGSITPDTTYYDNGYLIIDKTRIETYDAKARGKVNMQTVLDKSLNTGAVFAMRQLGRDNFKDYILNFGLGDKTGISLPDEAKGNVSGLNSSREIEYATASFGQGIAFTPLGFATAFSALANGGFIVQPYIIETVDNRPIIKRQAIKSDTSEEITRMLVKVVDEALLNGTVKVDHYTIAAKTGTAEIPFENQKGYSSDFLHTFVGYAPAFNAKFLTFLYLKRPQGAQYASQTLTSAFMDITKFLLNYYEIPPDR